VPKTLGRVRNRLRGARGMKERDKLGAWALMGIGVAAGAAPLFGAWMFPRGNPFAGPLVVLAGLAGAVLAARAQALRRESLRLRRSLARSRLTEIELKRQAFHDPLTKLANRALFIDRVEHALARGARERRSVAILFLDLDDFKEVNDSLGHAAGDELLVGVAHRIVACVRPSDTAARLGGDEFAVLLEDASIPEGATPTAERILHSLDEPFHLEGVGIRVRASVGVALGALPEVDTSRLLRNADAAMYRAKARGKGSYARYEPPIANNGARALVPGDIGVHEGTQVVFP